jgi:tetratricopeptide (TPR) repeat protein
MMGNIINPAKLEHAARDSVCEQCHLIGAARILNPGKQFSDFKAGRPLEDTFTIYHDQPTAGIKSALKVISHSEQLALSKCALASAGKLWCGTCHNPHNEPMTPVSFYRERCLLCHEKTTFAASHPDKSSNCIACHMPKREVQDGGHGVFTDHRIQRQPDSPTAGTNSVKSPEITPWRNPPAELATRNLGIAMIEAGMDRNSAKDILTGYRKLTEVQQQFPHDSEMYNSFGSALMAGRQYSEAAQAFELAVRFDPSSSKKETSLGQAYLLLGERDSGEHHLERAMHLDPLNLTAAAFLIQSYDQGGKLEKSEQLSRKLAGLTRATVSTK